MEIFWELTQVPEDFGATAVTIGNFDGVHIGHQAVLRRLAAEAAEADLSSIAVIFDPHPRQVHQPEEGIELITGTQERLTRMQRTGIDGVLVQHYDLDFAQQSPEEFIETMLVTGLRARRVAVGRDVRFGWQNTGDLSTLIAAGEQHGFEVTVIDDVGLEGRCSSTGIRELITSGELREANELLGHRHTVTGTVVHGDQRGRDLGFPTANLGGDISGLIPADGVYAGWAAFGDDPREHPAAISVGTNPTFEGVSRRVEAHVIDRDDREVMDFDLYGSSMAVRFVERLRGQIAFSGLEELIEQMGEDVDRVREILASEDSARD